MSTLKVETRTDGILHWGVVFQEYLAPQLPRKLIVLFAVWGPFLK